MNKPKAGGLHEQQENRYNQKIDLQTEIKHLAKILAISFTHFKVEKSLRGRGKDTTK
jgi:hypothetical protein